MISVKEALSKVLDLVEPLDMEMVDLDKAGGRTLASDVYASRDQPPFTSSAMDGYAINSKDLRSGAKLKIIGKSVAGFGYDGKISTGEAVRIFTGAPVPKGSDHILIQEDCIKKNDKIIINELFEKNTFIRPQGGDFIVGDVIKAPLDLDASSISLLAAMNVSKVPVFKKPIIALIATGDELVNVGESPNKDQIISSNNYGLKALIEASGGIARLLPIARDTTKELKTVFKLCDNVDLIVTLGGASVGDYDLVHSTAKSIGMETLFHKVAMRPGKPLMAGKIDSIPILGLPGNPVSALVCGTVFLIPAINAMLGKDKAALDTHNAILVSDLPQNGSREHYMRAETFVIEGEELVKVFEQQDSSLLTILSKANALLIRPVNDKARKKGDRVKVILLK